MASSATPAPTGPDDAVRATTHPGDRAHRDARTVPDDAMPRRVAIARTLLAAVAAAHALAIVVVLSLHGAVGDAIRAGQPSLGDDEVRALVLVELVRTLSFHALLVLVCGIYAARIGTGSARVLRIVAASQVLSVLFGTVTFLTAPDALRWVSPPFVVAALAILVCLLGSPEARAFFARRPRVGMRGSASGRSDASPSGAGGPGA